MELHERIKQLRLSRELTQQELANRIGITVRAFQNYENGTRLPKTEVLAKIAEELGVEQSALTSDEENFIIEANEKYGSRGRKSAQKLVDNAYSLFAGGELSDQDKAAVLAALQEAYVEAKIINKKYTPKKYRKVFSDDDEKK